MGRRHARPSSVDPRERGSSEPTWGLYGVTPAGCHVSGHSVTDSCAWRKDKPQINILSKKHREKFKTEIMQRLQEKDMLMQLKLSLFFFFFFLDLTFGTSTTSSDITVTQQIKKRNGSSTVQKILTDWAKLCVFFYYYYFSKSCINTILFGYYKEHLFWYRESTTALYWKLRFSYF